MGATSPLSTEQLLTTVQNEEQLASWIESENIAIKYLGVQIEGVGNFCSAVTSLANLLLEHLPTEPRNEEGDNTQDLVNDAVSGLNTYCQGLIDELEERERQSKMRAKAFEALLKRNKAEQTALVTGSGKAAKKKAAKPN